MNFLDRILFWFSLSGFSALERLYGFINDKKFKPCNYNNAYDAWKTES